MAPMGGDERKATPKVLGPRDLQSKLSEKLFRNFTRVQKAFQVYDTKHTGKVTYDEFRNALQIMGCELSEQEFKDFAAEYDKEGEGKIPYVQFNNRVGEMLRPGQNGGLIVMKPLQTKPMSRTRASPGM